MRLSFPSLVAFCLLALGCPRDVQDPERPPGRRCIEDSECTPPDAECGLVWACVDQVCEEEPSRTQPCR